MFDASFAQVPRALAFFQAIERFSMMLFKAIFFSNKNTLLLSTNKDFRRLGVKMEGCAIKQTILPF
jgi:hypothetical protein